MTIGDSVVEDRTRRLSALERVNHMLLALNTGVYMALFAAQVVVHWQGESSALVPAHHPPLLAWPLTLAAIAVVAWAIRDGVASRRFVEAAKADADRRPARELTRPS